MLGRLKQMRSKASGGEGISPKTPPRKVKIMNTGDDDTQASSNAATDIKKQPPALANFDACVEAADCMAAASTGTAGMRDSTSGLPDCCVLVSPDGNLLFELPKEAGASVEDTASSEIVNKNHYSLRENVELDEYRSAVVIGNDLQLDGNRAFNGFTAVGWSPRAASMSLRQSHDALKNMASFVEELVLYRKESAARSSLACDSLRTGIYDSLEVHTPVSNNNSNHGFFRSTSSTVTNPGTPARSVSGLSGASSTIEEEGGETLRVNMRSLGESMRDMCFPATPPPKRGRQGPLLHRGGTLHSVTIALEQYYAIMAENDAARWRMASSNLPLSPHASMTPRMTELSKKVKGLLPDIQEAADKALTRAKQREKALQQMQQHADAAELHLRALKQEAHKRWEALHQAEAGVTKMVEDRMLERSRERERKRMEKVIKQSEEHESQRGDKVLDSGATQAEIWELVNQVAVDMEDGSFAPTGLPSAPLSAPRDLSLEQHQQQQQQHGVESPVATSITDGIMDTRTEIEQQCFLPLLRQQAMAADEAVDEAAQTLLSVLSQCDTTRRSARIASEACLLSVGNSQSKCLKAIVALERASLEDRLANLKDLERIADNIDVRADLDAYITADKKEAGGSTSLGDEDDGGVAAALAVLTSHSEGIGYGWDKNGHLSTEGWSSYDDDDDGEIVSPDKIEGGLSQIFTPNPLLADSYQEPQHLFGLVKGDTNDREEALAEFEKNIAFFEELLPEKASRGRSHRASVCFALNQQRSESFEIISKLQFDGLVRVFDALLRGCDKEKSDIATAKMCMSLAQTFYWVEPEALDPSQSPGRGKASENEPEEKEEKRLYIKSRLLKHPLWDDDQFWDHSLFQCVAESLSNSGVMSNFETSEREKGSEWTETRMMKWHDLKYIVRSEAASQVHAVVFAQLSALSNTMLEFGCGIERAGAFVRRMCVRNQLPLKQRAILLQQLMAVYESTNEGEKDDESVDKSR